MTYCLGIITKYGLVMASDSRTNAGFDQVNVCRKMHLFINPGDRALVVLTSGSLSLSQSIVTLLRQDFDAGEGLASAKSFYDAARVIGERVRFISNLDRAALEKDEYKFNVNFILGGQINGEPPDLYLIYPQGNPVRATEDSPYLQIGEIKYGRPILDRGIQFEHTTLEEAAKFALISFDSTMRSNVTVGPPIDMVVYRASQFEICEHRRFRDKDHDLLAIHGQWERALRKGIMELPHIRFDPLEPKFGR